MYFQYRIRQASKQIKIINNPTQYGKRFLIAITLLRLFKSQLFSIIHILLKSGIKKWLVKDSKWIHKPGHVGRKK